MIASVDKDCWINELRSTLAGQNFTGCDIVAASMRKIPSTKIVIRQFLQQRNERGLLKPSALSDAMGYKKPSSALNQVLQGKRHFPMDKLDAVAAFFGWQPEELIRIAREETQSAADSGGTPRGGNSVSPAPGSPFRQQARRHPKRASAS
jgi:hypothetical protein